MKFSVGYQLFSDDGFVDRIIEYKDSVSEVYFSFGDFPNGRNSQLARADISKEEANKKQLYDLARIYDAGIGLNILFNAACYGKDSLARSFFEKIGDTVDYINENLGLTSVTTTSPVIAQFIKKNFDFLETRASVNMEIGTELGIEYLSEYFDGFYLKRELNRDFNKIKEIKGFCESKNKKLYALANSGCLNFCSAHNFHDSLVAHEREIAARDNGFSFSGVCSAFLSKEENIARIFDCTNFIRPEDIYLYEGLFTSVKLATRVNFNPTRILDAYIGRKRHRGSVFDLCEPNHTHILTPYIIENSYIDSLVQNGKLVYTNIEKALIKLEDKYVNK